MFLTLIFIYLFIYLFFKKLRNLLLEVLYRLPQNDALKTYATELLQLLMNLLRIENEDNAVICLKIIIELHRSYKTLLEDQVQPFLDIVQEMYRNMEYAVKDAFDSPGSSATPVASTVGLFYVFNSRILF